MSATPLAKFVATLPRERSGARSSNRFDFQLSWAFCLMLRLHQEKPDYLVVLDYHDDVVVFDSSQEPEAIELYQVKTKKPGNWSLDNLLERAKDSTLSIVGKMYAHRLAFGDEVRQMQFISNAL